MHIIATQVSFVRKRRITFTARVGKVAPFSELFLPFLDLKPSCWLFRHDFTWPLFDALKRPLPCVCYHLFRFPVAGVFFGLFHSTNALNFSSVGIILPGHIRCPNSISSGIHSSSSSSCGKLIFLLLPPTSLSTMVASAVRFSVNVDYIRTVLSCSF